MKEILYEKQTANNFQVVIKKQMKISEYKIHHQDRNVTKINFIQTQTVNWVFKSGTTWSGLGMVKDIRRVNSRNKPARNRPKHQDMCMHGKLI